jgi:aryl-alcohol dehydrogenase-like predicted oxidoreductase
METLSDVVAAGKARYIGFSEWPADKIQAALDMAGVDKFVSSQPQYSLVHRDPEDKIIPLCAANGISQIVWSPLGQGVLTGKYKPGKAPPPDSRATNERMNDYIGGMLREPLLVAVEKLKPLADEAGLSLPQFALAWILREPNIASAIIGASRPEQVIDNAAASGATVAPELFARAEAIIAEGMSTR